jgi:radical SAM superfamily enzyme YgiQ (UPF0313 family)
MLREPGAVLLVSCYELGHQPLALASPLGFLRAAGFAPAALDLAIEPLDPERVQRARFVGISVPMHTALRLGVRAAERIRQLNPECHLCFYGLYATLNAGYLLAHVADSVIGGEFEGRLVELVTELDCGTAGQRDGEIRGDRARRSGGERGRGIPPKTAAAPPESCQAGTRSVPAWHDSPSRARSSLALEKLAFVVPVREGLPGLERYAHLERDGQRVPAAYVEASRGCKHLCRHCPIPPVYGGRFFVVPVEVVLTDAAAQVAAGARHVTFGDPDFLNGPGHALRVARALHARFPDVTFDFTAKVEHLVRHRELLPEFARLGCVFLVSAVESLSDVVLEHLAKGHTREQALEAFAACREAGIALRPSLVAFTPWTRLTDYLDLLEVLLAERLVDQVDPVQYSIRLLVPPGSLLLESPALRPYLGELDQAGFHYRWTHPDPRMDRLHAEVTARVAAAAEAGEEPRQTFAAVRELAYRAAGTAAPPAPGWLHEPADARPPRLTESWFC